MRRTIVLTSAIAMLLATSSAFAADGKTSAEVTTDTGASSSDSTAPASGGAVLLGAKVGGIVPFSGLSPFASVGIEAGYVFPWMNRSFAAALDVDYTVPKADGTQTDPRIGATGGSYDWKLTEKEFAFMPVVMYRLTSLGRLTPYAGIGPRIYLLQSTVKGTANGGPIQSTTEQSTKVGVGVPVGVEYQLGPGGLLAELLFQYAGLDHTATGNANTGALSLSVGYRGLL